MQFTINTNATTHVVPTPHSVHLHAEGRGYCHQSVGTGKVIVEGSNNNQDFMTIVELEGNDCANLYHFWRYIRVTVDDGDVYHLVRGY